LKRNLINYDEPESVMILRYKIDKEREYLQKTIIMMELKQLAESISMIAFRKRVTPVNLEECERNRPLLWAQRI
jgi:hypothetical protein